MYFIDVVISSFAFINDLKIRDDPTCRNDLQFADGTYQETIGQVKTCWTFESGERVPITFEVLEDCCDDIILGESILYDYNIFEDHASSITTAISDNNSYHLAPFDFSKKWHYLWDDFTDLLSHQGRKSKRKSRQLCMI